jgi:hypothetical protein
MNVECERVSWPIPTTFSFFFLWTPSIDRSPWLVWEIL